MERSVSTLVSRPVDVVSAFVRDVRNLPAWSFFTAAEQVGDHWRVSSDEGEAVLRFTAPDAVGVLDHVVETAAGLVVQVPLRVAPHPGGSEVTLVVNAPADTIEQDVAVVTADLARLKALLEALRRSPSACGRAAS